MEQPTEKRKTTSPYVKDKINQKAYVSIGYEQLPALEKAYSDKFGKKFIQEKVTTHEVINLFMDNKLWTVPRISRAGNGKTKKLRALASQMSAEELDKLLEKMGIVVD